MGRRPRKYTFTAQWASRVILGQALLLGITEKSSGAYLGPLSLETRRATATCSVAKAVTPFLFKKIIKKENNRGARAKIIPYIKALRHAMTPLPPVTAASPSTPLSLHPRESPPQRSSAAAAWRKAPAGSLALQRRQQGNRRPPSVLLPSLDRSVAPALALIGGVMRLGAAPFSFPLLVRFGSASLPRTARYFRFVFGLGNSVYSFFSGCREMGLRCPPLSR
jgi:hypothetical protein